MAIEIGALALVGIEPRYYVAARRRKENARRFRRASCESVRSRLTSPE